MSDYSKYHMMLASKDEKQNLTNSLILAVVQSSQNQIDKSTDSLIAAFSQIDTQKSELEISKMAKQSIVISPVDDVDKATGKIIKVNKVIDSRNINFLAKKYGHHQVSGIIRLLLANLNEYFNIKNGLTLTQIKEIAQQIIDEVGGKMFIDELVYIFKKAKTHAKLFNNLDGSIIWGWIDEYLNNKAEQVHKEHEMFKTSAAVPTYVWDLAKKMAFVDDDAIQAHEERDLRNAGVKIKSGKPRPKKK